MTETQIKDYLQENGYPKHVVEGGRAGLIEKWRKFVAEVEQGYNFGIEDYRNDLDVRGIIQLAKAEDAVTHALDARFQKMLSNTEVRVWESAPDKPFWDFGYPKNAGPELIDDLRREKLLL